MKKSFLTGILFLLVISVSISDAGILDNINFENDMYGYQNNHEYQEWQKPARDALNMRLIGRALFGSCWQICIKDTLAYSIFGNSLMIFSIADVSNPTLLGYYDEACSAASFSGSYSYISDILIKDSYVYVSGSDITVFNISDPASIYEVGSCDGGYASSIVDTLMYTVNINGFNIINVSNPASPVMISSWIKPVDSKQIQDIIVQDSLAYVLDFLMWGGGNLSIVNVADPMNPQEIITFNDDNGNGTAICVLDSLLIMGSTHYSFDILSISDPSSPQLLYDGPYTNGYQVVIDLFAVNNLLYVALDCWDSMCLDIYDISYPSSPVLLSRNSIGAGGYREIQVINDIAYMAGEYGGFQILDVSDPCNVFELSCYANAGNNQIMRYNNTGIDIKDGIVYMPSVVPTSLDGNRYAATGLYVLDVTDPLSPSIMGYSHQWPSWSWGGNGDPGCPASAIEVVNEFAFQSQFGAGLVSTDVSDPSSPYIVSNCFAAMDGIADVDIEGSIAYTAHNWNPFIYDVSDPYGIPILGTLPIIHLTKVEVIDTLVYAVERMGYLGIINVADPASPQQLFCQNLNAKQTFVEDTLLYVARSILDINPVNGMAIYDISDPSSPVEIGSWQKDNFLATDVCVINNIAFLSSPLIEWGYGGSPGIWVLDVSDPATPVELGYYAGIGPCKITTDGAYIYASGSGSGLWILEYYGPVAGPVTVSLPTIYASPEDSIKVPVTVSSVTGKEITAAQFTITYDNSIVSLTDVVVDSSSIAWGTDWIMDWDTTGGTLTVNMSGIDTLTGVGPLVKIDFFVKPDLCQRTSTCILHFENFVFNSGQPEVVTHDGKVIVNIPASIVVTPDLLYFYYEDDGWDYGSGAFSTYQMPGNTEGSSIGRVTSESPISHTTRVQIFDIENESVRVPAESPVLYEHWNTGRGTLDTLSYDNDYFDYGRALVGDLTPDSTETYGYATYFVLSEFGLAPGDTLGGIMLYFAQFNGTDLRLYIWENAPGELRPASESEPLFVDMNVPAPVGPDWSWNTVFLAENEIVLPDTFWVGICYNLIANPPDWFVGYNSSLADIHTYGNSGGTCNDWQQQSEVFGIRAIIGDLISSQTADICIKNIGDFALEVTDITNTADWVTSVFPTNFTRILSGDSALVSVVVNATGLDNGIYHDTLHILSNDPSIPDYQVPVVFNINCLGIEEESTDEPMLFGLGQIYPNPVTCDANIQYSVENNTIVNLSIFDLSGRLIRTLVNEYQGPGHYSTEWDSKDASGNSAPSGVYFYCINTNNYTDVEKFVIVRQ